MAKTAVVAELFYSNKWNDITSDVFTRDPISITRGRPDESQRLAPSTLNLTLDNRTGKYSPRNPTSALYGLIARNTPIRVSVQPVRDTYTRNASGNWSTADSGQSWIDSGSHLSVTGTVGRITHNTTASLFNRLGNTNGMTDYIAQTTIHIGTKLTGTGAVYSQMLMRFQDSANYYTFGLFYQASGTPTGSLGVVMAKVVGGSQTNLFANFGFDVYNGSETFNLKAEVVGSTVRIKVWRTTVAEPLAWTAETTDTAFSAGSFAVLSRKDATITSVDPTVDYDDLSVLVPRFTGEVESWPQKWTVDGDNVWAPIVANGITRRLNAPGTTKPALSALRRTLSGNVANLLGWWTFENIEEGTTSVPSALANGAAMQIIDSSVTRSTDDTFPGSDVVPKTTLGVGAAVGASNFASDLNLNYVALLPSSGNSWSMMFWTRTILRQDAGSTTTTTIQVKVSGSAQIDTWFFTIRYNNASVAARVEISAFALNAAGNVVSAVSFPSTVNMPYVNAWRAWRVTVDLSGTDHRLRIWLDETLVNTVTAAGNTPGQPSGVYVQTQVTTSQVSLSYGQLLVAGGTGGNYIDTNAAQLFLAGNGYAGEVAATRMARLCTEQGIAFTVDGGTSEPLGVQRVAPFLDLMFDAADADGGVFYESRSSLGLGYQTYRSLLNQATTLTLNYSAGDEVAPSLEPVEDTDATVNDVTVTRFNGVSARVTQETGTLNVQEPPTGVGRYAKNITLVLAADSQALQQAAWIRRLGTWDEARYPVINVDFTALAVAGKVTLSNQAATLDIGERISIINPPAWLPPDSIEQRVQGYRETIESHHHYVAFNTTPALPYSVYQIQTDTNNLSRLPAADGESTLGGSLTTSATSVSVTSTNVRWIDSGTYGSQFPFKIVVTGEVMTVTAIAGTGLSQTFTVTRSTNGVVKAHSSGETVQLLNPPVIAR